MVQQRSSLRFPKEAIQHNYMRIVQPHACSQRSHLNRFPKNYFCKLQESQERGGLRAECFSPRHHTLDFTRN